MRVRVCVVVYAYYIANLFNRSRNSFITTELSLLTFRWLEAVNVVAGIVHFRYVTTELIEFLLCVCFFYYMHIQKFAIIKRKARQQKKNCLKNALAHTHTHYLSLNIDISIYRYYLDSRLLLVWCVLVFVI